MAKIIKQQTVALSQAAQEQTQKTGVQQPNPEQTIPPTASPDARQQIIWTAEGPASGRKIDAFLTSFKKGGRLLPILASVMTLAFYYTLPVPQSSTPNPYGPATLYPVFGLISAFFLILIYALLSWFFSTSTSLGMQDYALLEANENELRACLGNPNTTEELTENGMIKMIGIPSIKQDRRGLTALRQACNTFLALHRSLHSPERFQLLSNAGDVYAWGMIHRTEEALTEIEDIPIIIREALRDYAAIQGSNIENRVELLETLTKAIKDLDPEAIEYLKESESDKELNDLQKEIRELHKALETKNIIPNQVPHLSEKQLTHEKENIQNNLTKSEKEIRARAAIRYVKHTLNKFREDRLAGIIQARENLILSIIASGLITYGLLTLTIEAINDASKSFMVITSSTAIYIVGVTAGLFGRLYAESNKESATNDYGLSSARLLAILLISGLAAIGGVFITSLALNQQFPLDKAFTLDTHNILAAIIFGFAPNLLIRSFQRRADQYASDLESTKDK